MIAIFAETMILPVVPDFAEDIDISYVMGFEFVRVR
jgi:hypothetical protein